MTPKTLQALHGSIAKWRRIIAGTGVDLGPENCPLCQLFYWQGCNGCPVMAKTGLRGCEGTPYPAFVSYIQPADVPNGNARRKLAQAEADFLKSLLPREPSE